eukprot:TRINITY_DN10335_c0_g1_i1.p1 TRINITY_DN10335_c0_g1~~TRINITY_DN10335_c0_g1_i1.p1  ORF type:complete len:330 (-),score=56.20 TRINITY_DN10335_c0_g1_i1:54-1043(-)
MSVLETNPYMNNTRNNTLDHDRDFIHNNNVPIYQNLTGGELDTNFEQVISEEFFRLVEYSKNPDLSQFSESLAKVNEMKNRYPNILALDETLVKLENFEDLLQSSDYVHANFVDSPNRKREFIATQAPMPDQFDTFWNMIIQQKVSVVVMLTSLAENGVKKADDYLGTIGGATNFGNLDVCYYNQQDLFDGVTVREIAIYSSEDVYRKSPHYVFHIQCHNWPDRGALQKTSELFQLIQLTKEAQARFGSDDSPILVHCSAGIGRTGTFIAVFNAMLEVYKRGWCNIPYLIIKLRKQRYGVVTTLEQYRFIYKCVNYMVGKILMQLGSSS